MHSKIFQVSSSPITEDNEMHESRFDDVNRDVFDYVTEVKEQDSIISDYEWLNHVEGIEVNLEEKTFTVDKKKYFKVKHEKFIEQLEKLKNCTLEEFSSNKLYYDVLELKDAFDDKYSFYIDDDNEYFGLTTLDNFVRHTEPNNKYYLGQVFDYHF